MNVLMSIFQARREKSRIFRTSKHHLSSMHFEKLFFIFCIFFFLYFSATVCECHLARWVVWTGEGGDLIFLCLVLESILEEGTMKSPIGISDAFVVQPREVPARCCGRYYPFLSFTRASPFLSFLQFFAQTWRSTTMRSSSRPSTRTSLVEDERVITATLPSPSPLPAR